MGSATTNAAPLPKAPGPAPDLTDDAVLAARRAAMRQLAARRGLQSTFMTTPAQGSMGTGLGLGGGLGGGG